MKIVKRILVIVLVIIAIPLLAALFISSDYKSESVIIIDRPIAEVYNYVKYVKNQNNFGVWQLSNPQMTTHEEGKDGTVGYTYTWHGNKTGKGSQTITDLLENKRVETVLDFYMGEPAKSYFELEAVEKNQTKLTWGMSGRSPYPLNLISMFYDMSKDFDTGLYNLKNILENEQHDDNTFFRKYYQETLLKLSDAVSGLNSEQLHFKPSDSAWSISLVLEHILLTEKMLAEHIKQNMAEPANPERRVEIQTSDEEVLDMVQNRNEKFTAPAMLIGTGKYSSSKEALDDLHLQHQVVLEFLDGVEVDDLRNHISDSPFGPSDAFQSLLFMAGHTARHTAQIQEVMAHPHFPK